MRSGWLALAAAGWLLAGTGAAEEFGRLHYAFGEWCGCTAADVGIWDSASDNYDETGDHLMSFGVWEGYAALYHINEPGGWDGPTGFYDVDLMSVPAPDETRTWGPIYLWATPDYADPNMAFSLLMDEQHPLPSNREYTLELIGLPKDYVWPAGAPTSWIIPQGVLPLTIYMPTFTTQDGLEGYQFQVTMSAVVPEPTSAVGVGLALFVLRRRVR